MNAKDILLHPLSAISVVGSLLLSTVGVFSPVWEFLGATSGTWFTMLAVTAGTILPNVGYPNLGTQLLLAASIVYVTIYADRFLDRLDQYRNR